MSGNAPGALPHIDRLHAYTPGVQPTDKGWVKLNTNELPLSTQPESRRGGPAGTRSGR